MAGIKSMENSSDKWVRRASVAGPDYQAGVENPKVPWEDAAFKGDANYRIGVTKAASEGRFAAGVKKAGNAKWKANALKKGPGRFAEGVAIGREEWQKGFAPYHAAIGSIALPPRGPKGDPNNIQRVAAIANTLRALRIKAG